MGHSQGAGHAAYLGNTKKIKGAIMVSGPQDECIDCPLETKIWIDKKYKSKKYTAFAYGQEPLLEVMKNNWKRMTVAGATTWNEGVINDVDFAVNDDYDPCEGPLVSNIMPASTSTCGGPGHCSTAIDDSVPFIKKWNNETLYVYAINVWPKIVKENKRCK